MNHSYRAVRVAVVFGLASLVAGCGGVKTAKGASTSIVTVEMKAMTFAPATIEVRSGQAIKFRFHNTGTVVHEALIGDSQAQDAHEKGMGQMGAMSGDGMNHSEVVQVQPGGYAELSYHFSQPGTLILGCHEPGHYAAGMRATVEVR
jgi:uncharacterized cupredoxin-like copper-binding protein